MKLPVISRVAPITILLLSSIWCDAAWVSDHPLSYGDQDQTVQTAPAPSQRPTSSDQDWHLRLTPYLWFTGVSGTTGVFGHDVTMQLSPGDLLSHFRTGLMANVEARKNRFVFPLDFLWIKLRADNATSFDPEIRQPTARHQRSHVEA